MTAEQIQMLNGWLMMIIGAVAAVFMIRHARILWRARRDPLAMRMMWVPITDAAIMAPTIYGGWLLATNHFAPEFWIFANGAQWVTAMASAVVTLVVINFYIHQRIKRRGR